MNTLKQTGERGLVRWILLIVIAIVLASYFFDFSVQDAVEDEQTQSNFGYIQKNAIEIWDTYLASTANYLWNDIFIELIWESFVDNMQQLKDGENTVFENNSPGVDVSTTSENTNGPVTAGNVERE